MAIASDRNEAASGRADAAAALRRRNLRTGWLLGGVALCLALSIWYSKLG